MYTYFTGVQFKQRIEGIVERFSDMRRDLDRERAAMMRTYGPNAKHNCRQSWTGVQRCMEISKGLQAALCQKFSSLTCRQSTMRTPLLNEDALSSRALSEVHDLAVEIGAPVAVDHDGEK